MSPEPGASRFSPSARPTLPDGRRASRLIAAAILGADDDQHACRAGGANEMTPLYVAGALLVVAQGTGIYALVSKKADLIFALVMMVLVVAGLAAGALGTYNELH
jgi:hypothetical protein